MSAEDAVEGKDFYGTSNTVPVELLLQRKACTERSEVFKLHPWMRNLDVDFQYLRLGIRVI